MANNSTYRMDVEMNYKVNQSSFNTVKQSLDNLQKMASDKLNQQINLKADVRDAQTKYDNLVKTISIVQDALNRSYNFKLNSVNLQTFNKELRSTQLSLNQVYTEFAQYGDAGVKTFGHLAVQVAGSNLQLKETSTLTQKIGDTFFNAAKYRAATAAINGAVGAIQQAYGYVKHLDSSLNDIMIVTQKSSDNMKEFAKTANEAAKGLGKSTTDYTEAALIYYQQGLGDAEVQARTETTLKAANVTGQSTAAVSEELTAVWNGYKVSAEQTELYVDKIAAVASKTASNLEELSTGMSKVASAANLMGVDIDQLNAQLATVISVTRQAPETVGTAFKTIYARMGDIKAGLDDEVTLGQYTSKMAEMGVNVLDANNQLRDMGDVIEEIGGKWNTMSREQQIALSQVMAGTRQYNNLLSLFDNWDMYTKAIDTSKNTMGTLQQQQDIYMQSTEAKLQQMSTAWEDMYDSLLNPEMINPIIEGLTKIINTVTSMIDGLGGGETIFLGIGSLITSFASSNIGQVFADFATNAETAKLNADMLKQSLDFIDQSLLQLSKAGQLDNISQDLLKMQKTADKIALAKNIKPEQFNEIKKKIQETNNAVIELRNSQEKLGEVTTTVSKATLGLNITQMKGQASDWAATLTIVQGHANELQNAINQINKEFSDAKFAQIPSDKVGKDLEEALRPALRTVKQQMQDLFKDLSGSGTDNILKTQILDAFNNIDFSNIETAKKQIQELAQKIQDMKDSVSGGVHIFSNDELNAATTKTEQFKMLVKNLVNELQIDMKKVSLQSLITDVTKGISGLGQLASSIKSLQNLGSIWNNDDLETSEKMLQTFTTLGFAIPMLITGFESISGAILALTSAEGIAVTVKKILNKEITIETLQTELSTIGKNSHTVALVLNTIAQIQNNAALMAALPAIIAVIAVIAVVTASLLAWNKYLKENAKREDEAAEAAVKASQERAEANREELKSINTLKTAYDELNEQYKKGEIDLGELKSKTYELCKQYEQENLAIQTLTASYKELNDIMNDITNKSNNTTLETEQELQDSLNRKFKTKAVSKTAGIQWWNSSVDMRDNLSLGVGTAVGGVLGPMGMKLGAEIGGAHRLREADAKALSNVTSILGNNNFAKTDFEGNTIGVDYKNLVDSIIDSSNGSSDQLLKNLESVKKEFQESGTEDGAKVVEFLEEVFTDEYVAQLRTSANQELAAASDLMIQKFNSLQIDWTDFSSVDSEITKIAEDMAKETGISINQLKTSLLSQIVDNIDSSDQNQVKIVTQENLTSKLSQIQEDSFKNEDFEKGIKASRAIYAINNGAKFTDKNGKEREATLEELSWLQANLDIVLNKESVAEALSEYETIIANENNKNLTLDLKTTITNINSKGNISDADINNLYSQYGDKVTEILGDREEFLKLNPTKQIQQINYFYDEMIKQEKDKAQEYIDNIQEQKNKVQDKINNTQIVDINGFTSNFQQQDKNTQFNAEKAIKKQDKNFKTADSNEVNSILSDTIKLEAALSKSFEERNNNEKMAVEYFLQYKNITIEEYNKSQDAIKKLQEEQTKLNILEKEYVNLQNTSLDYNYKLYETYKKIANEQFEESSTDLNTASKLQGKNKANLTSKEWKEINELQDKYGTSVIDIEDGTGKIKVNTQKIVENVRESLVLAKEEAEAARDHADERLKTLNVMKGYVETLRGQGASEDTINDYVHNVGLSIGIEISNPDEIDSFIEDTQEILDDSRFTIKMISGEEDAVNNSVNKMLNDYDSTKIDIFNKSIKQLDSSLQSLKNSQKNLSGDELIQNLEKQNELLLKQKKIAEDTVDSINKDLSDDTTKFNEAAKGFNIYTDGTRTDLSEEGKNYLLSHGISQDDINDYEQRLTDKRTAELEVLEVDGELKANKISAAEVEANKDEEANKGKLEQQNKDLETQTKYLKDLKDDMKDLSGDDLIDNLEKQNTALQAMISINNQQLTVLRQQLANDLSKLSEVGISYDATTNTWSGLEAAMNDSRWTEEFEAFYKSAETNISGILSCQDAIEDATSQIKDNTKQMLNVEATKHREDYNLQREDISRELDKEEDYRERNSHDWSKVSASWDRSISAADKDVEFTNKQYEKSKSNYESLFGEGFKFGDQTIKLDADWLSLNPDEIEEQIKEIYGENASIYLEAFRTLRSEKNTDEDSLRAAQDRAYKMRSEKSSAEDAQDQEALENIQKRTDNVTDVAEINQLYDEQDKKIGDIIEKLNKRLTAQKDLKKELEASGQAIKYDEEGYVALDGLTGDVLSKAIDYNAALRDNQGIEEEIANWEGQKIDLQSERYDKIISAADQKYNLAQKEISAAEAMGDYEAAAVARKEADAALQEKENALLEKQAALEKEIADYRAQLAAIEASDMSAEDKARATAELTAKLNVSSKELDEVSSELVDIKNKLSAASVINSLDKTADVTNQIKGVTRELSRLQKVQKGLSGKDLIANLQKQITVIKRQIELEKKKLAILQEQLKTTLKIQLSRALEAGGLSLSDLKKDSSGYLMGLEAALKKVPELSAETAKAINDAFNAYNNGVTSILEQEDKIFDLNNSIKDLQDDINKEMENIAKEATDKLKEKMNKELEWFNMKVDVELDIAEATRRLMDLKAKLKGLEDNDILGNAVNNMNKLQTYFRGMKGSYFDADSGAISGVTSHLSAIMGEINLMQAGAESSLYGKDQSKAFDDLNKYRDELMSQVEAAYEMIKNIKQSYLDQLDKIAGQFDNVSSAIEHLNSVLEHDIKLVNLLYGGDKDKLINLYNKQIDALDQDIVNKRKKMEYFEAVMEKEAAGSEAWLKAKDAYESAAKDLDSAVENRLDKTIEKYATAVEKLAEDMNKNIFGKTNLDAISEEWELKNKFADRYLDTVNKSYAIESLRTKMVEGINATDSIKAQERLRNIMNEQLAILQNKEKVSQYDVDRAQKLYDIEVKRLALEEAKNNKSKMKLRRDEQGNYRYEYVADEDNILKKKQELLDAQNDLYNFDKDRYKSTLDESMQIYKEYQQKWIDLEKERQIALAIGDMERAQEIQNQMDMLTNTYQSAFADIGRDWAEAQTNWHASTIEAMMEQDDALVEKINEDFTSFEETIFPGLSAGIQALTESMAEDGLKGQIDACKEAADLYTSAFKDELLELQAISGQNFDLASKGLDENIMKTQALIIEEEDLLNQYEQEMVEIENLIAELEALEAQYKAVMEAALAAVDAALALREQMVDDDDDSDNNSYDSVAGSSSISSTSGTGTITGQRYVNVWIKGNKAEIDTFGLGADRKKGVAAAQKKYPNATEHYNIPDSQYVLDGWKKHQVSFDTGGYTGNWNSQEGKLAVLHKKELVLNNKDTTNMLKAISFVREISPILEQMSMIKATEQMAASMQSARINLPNELASISKNDTLEQNVHINANFPNVSSSKEIEDALMNLSNLASQHVLSKKR